MGNIYNKIIFESHDYNVIKFNLDNEKLLNQLYQLYYDNIIKVKTYLINNNFNVDDFGIKDIDNYTIEVKCTIKERFINNNKLDWKSHLESLFVCIFKKYTKNFEIIDSTSKDDEDRYEQYIDILSNMFGNIEEYIEKEYNKFQESKKVVPNINNKLRYTKFIMI